MMDLVPGRSSLDLDAADVVEVFRSINQNLMSAEGHPPQPSEAAVIGFRRGDRVGLATHYFLYQDGVGLLYVEQDPVTPATYHGMRGNAIDAVEAMGFLMESLNWRQKSPAERAAVMAELPAFGGRGREVGQAPTTASTAEPESVLMLDQTATVLRSEPPRTPAALGAISADTWRVFFRLMASL